MRPHERLIYTALLLILATLVTWGTQTPKKPSATPERPTSQQDAPIESRVQTIEQPQIVEQTNASPDTQEMSDTARVMRIIDGDTFTTEDGATVRMIGMNTPELFPRDGSGKECYSAEAATRTIELIFQKNVRLVKDVSNTDKYGRLLRYVYVDDMFVNKELVSGGFARVRAYKPDTAHHKELLAAMNIAQAERRGLWGACN